jgi:hypothetical protein
MKMKYVFWNVATATKVVDSLSASSLGDTRARVQVDKRHWRVHKARVMVWLSLAILIKKDDSPSKAALRLVCDCLGNVSNVLFSYS